MARKGQLQKAVTINGVRKFFYGKTYEEIEEKIQKYQNGTQLDFCKEYEDWLYTIKKFTVKESTFDRLETTYLHFHNLFLNLPPLRTYHNSHNVYLPQTNKTA